MGRSTLDFLGAVGTVTGSRYLLRADSGRVLVDCGLFQGLRELRRRNWDPFPVEPASIDAAIVSHAHLDHSGYLPALVRDGFAGSVHVTDNTAKLAQIVLSDSAHLLMEDTEHAREHGYSRHTQPRPLYTDADVDRAVARFRTTAYDEPVTVVPDVETTLRRAGHILGSASVYLRAGGTRILFSGDLGRPHHPLLLPPEPPPAADVVVVEATYGNRSHPHEDGEQELGTAITRTIRRGGSVIIPAFAVDRTEVILMALRRLRMDSAIPDVPIYVDSPMALTALQVYRTALRHHSPEIRPDVQMDGDPFDPGNVHELHTVQESMTLNEPKWPCIIVSASGMASGGRVLHHLAGMLPNPDNTVILAGYQAIGTRGRQLIDGAAALKIHGRYIPVRAEVVDVSLFSAHADADEVIGWLRQAPTAPQTCYVVHSEPDAAATMRTRIQKELGWTAVIPTLGERVRID